MNHHLKLLSSLNLTRVFLNNNRIVPSIIQQQRKFTTKNSEINLQERDLSRAFFRTDLSNPAEHNDLHHGLFYRIPNDIANRLFLLGGFDKLQQETLKVFQETAIMIRKPALEVIDYLRRTDFTKPPNSYVLCK